MTCDQGLLEPQLKGQFIRSAGDKLDQQVMANALERCSQRHRVYLFDDTAIVGGGDRGFWMTSRFTKRAGS